MMLSEATIIPQRYTLSKAAAFVAFLLLTVTTLAVTSYLPIYTDETLWKLIQGRYFYDGGKFYSPLPMCELNDVAVPVLLLPFRLFDTALYQDNLSPDSIRSIGVGLAVAWGVICWGLLRNSLKNEINGIWLSIIVIAISTLGIMPFLLVTNRPEQIILIGITIFSLPVLFNRRMPPRMLARDIAAACGVILFCGYFFSSHPRAIFSLPIVLIFLRFAFSRTVIFLGTSASIILLGFIATMNWVTRLKCNDPWVGSLLAESSITSALSEHRLAAFLHSQISMLLSDPGTFFYLSQLRMDIPTTWDMVPSHDSIFSTFTSVWSEMIMTGLVVFGLLAFLLLLIDSIERRSFSLRLAMLSGLWGFYIASLLARSSRYAYEAALIQPLLGMAALGSLWVARDLLASYFGKAQLRFAAVAGLGFLLSASVISQITLIYYYAPLATGAWSQPGYISGQKYSVSVASDVALRNDIAETGRLCGIDPKTRPHHLIVDELTIFSYLQASQPYLVTYIEEMSWGKTIQDYPALLKKIASSGVVVSCARVPLPLQSSALRNGNFCCLGAF